MTDKKITLIYFYHRRFDHTPLDLGYVIAYLIKNNYPADRIKFRGIEMDDLKFFSKRNELQRQIRNEAEKILEDKPDHIFFFLDNILKTLLYYEFISLEFAREIKKIKPKIKIGIHSYQIDQAKSKKLIEKNNQLDFVFRGEPEKIFLNFLRTPDLSRVNGISYREKGGIKVNMDESFIENLNNLPSPYLSGIFDEFIEKKTFKHVFLSTNRGCPFACHYCYRGAKFPKLRYFSISRVLQEFAYLQKKGIMDIFIMDDNFIVSPKIFFKFVDAYKKRFPLKNTPTLGMMTRPEVYTSEKVVKAMSEINTDRVQIGLQTINPKLQYLMNRSDNFDFKIFKKVKKWFKKYQIKLRQIDLIFGLPGDSMQYFKKSLAFSISLHPKKIQIKQLHFIEGTLLSKQLDKYGIKVGRRRFFNVPFVSEVAGFSEQDMARASTYVKSIMYDYPDIKFKLLAKNNIID